MQAIQFLSPLHTGRVVFSPYKDVSATLDEDTNTIFTNVTGTVMPLAQGMPLGMQTVTLAFATGECGAELWNTYTPDRVAPNIPALIAAGKTYIISTGGEGGIFTCASNAAFMSFIQTYFSANMLGVDFDIESRQSPIDIANLVARVKYAKTVYPTMRFSFTIATLGGSVAGVDQLGSSLSSTVMQAIKDSGMGWNNVFINLMVMDYGNPATADICSVKNNVCDMGKSAINAATSLHTFWGVPYSSIELTPLIGGNGGDINGVISNVFTIGDAITVAAYVMSMGLGGVHFWALERDRDSPPGVYAEDGNSYGLAGTLGFSTAFLHGLVHA